MGLTTNFSQLGIKLEALELKIQKEYSDKALKAGGEIMLKGQEQTVPVLTGELKNSLLVGKISGKGAKRKVLIGIDPSKAAKLKYGFYLEYGTKNMVARKWMKTAWINKVNEAKTAINESLARDLGGH